MSRKFTRREVAGTALAGGAVALAGCLGGDDDGNGEDDDGGTRIVEDFVLSNHTLSGEFPFRLVEADSGVLVARYHGHGGGDSHWHRQPVQVPVDGQRSLELEIFDQQRERIPVDEDGFTFDVRVTEETPADLFDVSRTGDVITLTGHSEGEGEFVIDLIDGGDVEFTTTACGVEVVPEAEME